MIDRNKINLLAIKELAEASKTHRRFFASNHEGESVLREEVKETAECMDNVLDGYRMIETRVQHDEPVSDLIREVEKHAYLLVAEAIQVFAMLLKMRFSEKVRGGIE